ncbi:MAG: GntR family transcriptional regulator [Rhizobiaceae bacterium]|nr:GntR family transcriptional regulator [Rhizobiaceae bacterium]
MSTPLPRQTTTDLVAQYIARKIVNGEYAGGEQLRQEAIAAELGVSRIPVREALVQLEAEGLVVIRAHRGAVVSELTADDAIDIFDTRMLLEPYLVKKAMARVTADELQTVENALVEYEAAVARGDARELSQLNWKFHLALLAPSGRVRSLALLQSLYTSADRYLLLQIEPLAAQTKAGREHREVFEFYRKGNALETERLMRRHLADARKEIVSHLKQ